MDCASELDETIRLRNTFSFWATVVGASLGVARPTRRAGAMLLLLAGYGGVGVAWERTCGCDLRRFHRPPRKAYEGLLTHLPMVVLGHLLLAEATPSEKGQKVARSRKHRLARKS